MVFQNQNAKQRIVPSRFVNTTGQESVTPHPRSHRDEGSCNTLRWRLAATEWRIAWATNHLL